LKRFALGAEQADDITILVLQYKNPSGTNAVLAQSVKLVLENRIEELEKIAIALDNLSEQWNLPPKVVMEINLVLEELFTNVVFYAFDDQQDHQIILDFTRLDSGLLQIRLEDDGKPFNLLEKKMDDVFDKPLEERRIGGLGIHFVREMMNNVEYQRAGEKNIVILTKNF
jgi:anti-sigma regulatory factor (Ser/Thr protein kinase)